MKLITKEIQTKLTANFETIMNRNGGSIDDLKVVLKLFTPDANFTWYVVSAEPIKDDDGKIVDIHLYGVVVGNYTEWGYSSLKEITEVRGPLGLTIERDMYFDEITVAELNERVVESGVRL